MTRLFWCLGLCSLMAILAIPMVGCQPQAEKDRAKDAMKADVEAAKESAEKAADAAEGAAKAADEAAKESAKKADEAVKEAAMKTMDRSFKESVQHDKEALEFAAKKDIKVITLPDAELEKFRAKLKPLWDAQAKRSPYSAKLVEILKEHLKSKGVKF